jgi:hypothetical protein
MIFIVAGGGHGVEVRSEPFRCAEGTDERLPVIGLCDQVDDLDRALAADL